MSKFHESVNVNAINVGDIVILEGKNMRVDHKYSNGEGVKINHKYFFNSNDSLNRCLAAPRVYYSKAIHHEHSFSDPMNDKNYSFFVDDNGNLLETYGKESRELFASLRRRADHFLVTDHGIFSYEAEIRHFAK